MLHENYTKWTDPWCEDWVNHLIRPRPGTFPSCMTFFTMMWLKEFHMYPLQSLRLETSQIRRLHCKGSLQDAKLTKILSTTQPMAQDVFLGSSPYYYSFKQNLETQNFASASGYR